MGASSRSPSPMTMVPRMGTVSMVARMASVATWSALWRSPVPMVCAEAIAASSTTRANSSASSNSITLERFFGTVLATRWVAIMSSDAAVTWLKSADSGDVLAQDQRMNIVRTLVCLHRLQIHHVAHHRIIVGNAVCAQDIAGHARAFQRHPHVIALGHGDVLMPDFIRVLEPSHL